jgi:hypothetical protein
MSFYDDASLVFLPSGEAGKDGKAYSMKPTDGSGDFTFSRGSNLTATRVDSNGLIEKGRENLFLNSDTPATQSITITNGGVYVLSFLGTGSVVASGGASFTLNGTGEFDRVQNYFISSSTSVTLTISGTITEPQLELGLAATEYIKSGATTGLAGILEDSPRFDYSGGASCPSLLLEPSRTNEIGYSEYFEGWTQQGSPTITSNYGTSPEGLQNSSRLKYTTDSDYIETSVTNTSGVFSIYAKGTGNIILTDSGANASSTTALTSSYQRIDLYFSTNTTTLQIKTDSSGLDAEVYGAQFENATYKTSYIPNHSGGSVTREAESFEKTGLSSVIGQTEGTIFFEFEYSHQQINVPFFRVLENASNFYEIIALSGFKLRSRARIGGSIVANITTSSVVSEGTHKAAIIYKSRDYKFYLDGSLVGSSTESSIVSNLSEINYFDNNNNLKQFLIFPTALSDADCITLTS